MTRVFDTSMLLQEATARTGLCDFGPGTIVDGLDVLVRSLNEQAQIRDTRWHVLNEELLRLLVNRLWLAHDLAAHPEIAEQQIVAPVIISSMPRTGSTKLHRMLEASGEFRTAAMWECREFARIPGRGDGGMAERIAKTVGYERWRYSVAPELLVLHPTFAHAADEDLLLLQATFREPSLAAAYFVPEFALWVSNQELQASYDYFLLQLKYLQWQAGGEPRRWLLKSPSHLGYESYLGRIFPDMKLIVPHRDPVACVASVCKLMRSMQGLYSDFDSGTLLGPQFAGMFSESMRKHLSWRDENPHVPALDIAYRDIEKNDLAAVREVFRFLQKPLADDVESKMREWSRDNAKNKHGVNRYASDEAGMAPDSVREAFGSYIARYSDLIGLHPRLDRCEPA